MIRVWKASSDKMGSCPFFTTMMKSSSKRTSRSSSSVSLMRYGESKTSILSESNAETIGRVTPDTTSTEVMILLSSEISKGPKEPAADSPSPSRSTSYFFFSLLTASKISSFFCRSSLANEKRCRPAVVKRIGRESLKQSDPEKILQGFYVLTNCRRRLADFYCCCFQRTFFSNRHKDL